MQGHIRWLVVIILLTAFAVWVVLPGTLLTNIPDSCYTVNSERTKPIQGIHLDFNDDCVQEIQVDVRQALGLDIIGGLRVLLEAELPPGTFTIEDLNQAANNVSRRVNALGVGEATVQVQGSNRLLVELPGVTDTCQAITTIQRTALLEFVDFGGLAGQAQALIGRPVLTTQQQTIIDQRNQAGQAEAAPSDSSSGGIATDPAGTPAAVSNTLAECEPQSDTTRSEAPILNPATGQPFTTVITGAGLQAAAAELDPNSQQWVIRFELTTEGGSVFGPFTGSRIGQPLAIVLDGQVLSAPTVQARLDTGGVISGSFTEDEAKQLALQLRSGALPIPLRVESSETVGATLGQQSVELSIRAGIIGVIVILIFMVVNYRVPGIAAALALLVFIALNLAVFKIIPVTLTLPAIVGFLISIGTAVDGNILIFERLREEVRSGKTIDKGVEEGFSRAWTSIRDSNLSTILITSVLFLFGQTPGASIVSGFAVTLILGLIINLFTAVIVTRTFLHIILYFTRKQLAEHKWLVGV
ncbi:MAG TPA: protein translocase subunit SecD [Aggregatilineales bacterium]|nr:protein translocase subunit SecD [Aggregatilineales bacterium]